MQPPEGIDVPRQWLTETVPPHFKVLAGAAVRGKGAPSTSSRSVHSMRSVPQQGQRPTTPSPSQASMSPPPDVKRTRGRDHPTPSAHSFPSFSRSSAGQSHSIPSVARLAFSAARGSAQGSNCFQLPATPSVHTVIGKSKKARKTLAHVGQGSEATPSVHSLVRPRGENTGEKKLVSHASEAIPSVHTLVGGTGVENQKVDFESLFVASGSSSSSKPEVGHVSGNTCNTWQDALGMFQAIQGGLQQNLMQDRQVAVLQSCVLLCSSLTRSVNNALAEALDGETSVKMSPQATALQVPASEVRTLRKRLQGKQPDPMPAKDEDAGEVPKPSQTPERDSSSSTVLLEVKFV